MKLTLGENAIVQSGSVFDQETDPIDSDLILVMDRFDREEVAECVMMAEIMRFGSRCAARCTKKSPVWIRSTRAATTPVA